MNKKLLALILVVAMSPAKGFAGVSDFMFGEHEWKNASTAEKIQKVSMWTAIGSGAVAAGLGIALGVEAYVSKDEAKKEMIVNYLKWIPELVYNPKESAEKITTSLKVKEGEGYDKTNIRLFSEACAMYGCSAISVLSLVTWGGCKLARAWEKDESAPDPSGPKGKVEELETKIAENEKLIDADDTEAEVKTRLEEDNAKLKVFLAKALLKEDIAKAKAAFKKATDEDKVALEFALGNAVARKKLIKYYRGLGTPLAQAELDLLVAGALKKRAEAKFEPLKDDDTEENKEEKEALEKALEEADSDLDAARKAVGAITGKLEKLIGDKTADVGANKTAIAELVEKLDSVDLAKIGANEKGISDLQTSLTKLATIDSVRDLDGRVYELENPPIKPKYMTLANVNGWIADGTAVEKVLRTAEGVEALEADVEELRKHLAENDEPEKLKSIETERKVLDIAQKLADRRNKGAFKKPLKTKAAAYQVAKQRWVDGQGQEEDEGE